MDILLLVNSLDKELAQRLRVPKDGFFLNPVLTEVAVRDGQDPPQTRHLRQWACMIRMHVPKTGKSEKQENVHLRQTQSSVMLQKHGFY